MSSKAMGALKNNIIQVLTINKRTLMNSLTAIQGLILQVVWTFKIVDTWIAQVTRSPILIIHKGCLNKFT
jgi:hypothetical protein